MRYVSTTAAASAAGGAAGELVSYAYHRTNRLKKMWYLLKPDEFTSSFPFDGSNGTPSSYRDG